MPRGRSSFFSTRIRPCRRMLSRKSRKLWMIPRSRRGASFWSSTIRGDVQNSLASAASITLVYLRRPGPVPARGTFKKIGGFKEIPVMEDVEIQGRLRKGEVHQTGLTGGHLGRRYLQNGPLWQHLMTTGVVLLYHLGVSPHLLGPVITEKGKGEIR